MCYGQLVSIKEFKEKLNHDRANIEIRRSELKKQLNYFFRQTIRAIEDAEIKVFPELMVVDASDAQLFGTETRCLGQGRTESMKADEDHRKKIKLDNI